MTEHQPIVHEQDAVIEQTPALPRLSITDCLLRTIVEIGPLRFRVTHAHREGSKTIVSGLEPIAVHLRGDDAAAIPPETIARLITRALEGEQ